jgi:dTDP-glucose 4,6-dehydratase
MRVVVTGGAGFIGSNFVRKFIEGNYPEIQSITVVDKLTYAGNLSNFPKNFLEKIVFVQADICDFEMMNNVCRNQDAIINFAAESHVDRSIKDSGIFMKTNVLGTQNLLEAALRNNLKKFIQISTDEVYGSITDYSWDESCPISPNSPYSASKASADILALSYFKTFGLDVRITRCSNNFGPNQHLEKFIPLTITSFIDGVPVPIYGDGQNIRDWIHVDDHCQAVYKVLSHGKAGEIYNIGAGNEFTNLELVSLIIKIMGLSESQVQLRYVPDRKGHDYRYSVSFEKISKELNYFPQVKLSEGLLNTISWYKSHAHWWKTLS